MSFICGTPRHLRLTGNVEVRGVDVLSGREGYVSEVADLPVLKGKENSQWYI